MEGGGNVKREGEGHREIERVSKEKREERKEGGLGILYERVKERRKGKVRVCPFFWRQEKKKKRKR